MDTFYLSVSSEDGKGKKSSFSCDLLPPLDVYKEGWKVALFYFRRNYTIEDQEIPSVYLHTNIIENVQCGNTVLPILRDVSFPSMFTSFQEEDLHYINVKKDVYSVISFELTDDKGRTVKTSAQGTTIITLKFINVKGS